MFLDSIIFPFKFRTKFKDIDLIKQHQISGVWLSIILKYLLRVPLYTRTGYDMQLFARLENKGFVIRCIYFIFNQLGLLFSDIFTVSNSFDLKNTKKRYLITKKYLFKNQLDYKKKIYTT